MSLVLPDENRIEISPNLSHIIWDWNGTLLDDAWLCVEVMRSLLERYGLPPIDLDRYSRIFRFPVIEYYVELGFDFDTHPFEVVGTQFIEGYSAREHLTDLRPEARETLTKVSEMGLTQSVLSASERQRLGQQALRLDVHTFFDDVVALEDHYAGSKIDIGRRWLKESGLDKDRVLLVGDTDHDAQVASALGIPCVLLPSGHQDHKRLASTGLPIINSLDNLVAVLDRCRLDHKSDIEVKASSG